MLTQAAARRRGAAVFSLPDEDADRFARLRTRELGRLDRTRHTYLDWTGSALPPASLVRAHARVLCRTVLGNPHSDSVASRESTQLVEDARAAVLEFLDADPREYEVSFTSNATGALRLVGESFPFAQGSDLVLTADNHNSVNGIRTHARAGRARVRVLPLSEDLRLGDGIAALGARRPGPPSLFAFPAQSNFSGVRHSLALIGEAHALGYHVLLDAAAYVPTAPLSLREHPADFVALSLYKIAGYPSGLGALVMRRAARALLRRPTFSGGTVEAVSASTDVYVLKESAEAFEDGTVNFMGIAAVPAALDFVRSLNLARVKQRVGALASTLRQRLCGLQYPGGAPVVRMHSPDGEDCGGTLAFNVLRRDGSVVPYWDVEARAREQRVSIRGGCFCNPGAAERALGIDGRALAQCLNRVRTEGIAFSHAWLAGCLGTPVGALRMSLGYGSDLRDVERGVSAIADWRA